MKRIVCFGLIVLLLLPAACAAPAAEQTSAAVSAAAATPAPTTAQDAIDAATADELRAMIAQYKSEGDYEMVYAAALRLTELEPSDAAAYTNAAAALLAMSQANFEEIDRLLALGVQNAQDAQAVTEWAQNNQPELSIAVPFVPDYASADEVNADGITTGNQTNAGKYSGWWRGGLLTWQGDWVYLSRPDENFAIYKMRADGSDYQRVGTDSGSSLNVIGDWLYYINLSDGDKPYRMRTDGSMREKLGDDECSFLSVSGGYMYYDNGSDSGRLYKTGIDGGESTGLTDATAIFSCVADGWVYYCEKSMEGGLYRISVDGGEPQLVVQGFIQTYCVAGDWVYYIDTGDPYGVRRVHTDGTRYEVFFPFDFPITTFNVAGDTLYIGFGIGYEEDGFFVSQELVTIDIATRGKGWHTDADTEPVCTGPDGWLYVMKYGEGLPWYAMDANGAASRIG